MINYQKYIAGIAIALTLTTAAILPYREIGLDHIADVRDALTSKVIDGIEEMCSGLSLLR